MRTPKISFLIAAVLLLAVVSISAQKTEERTVDPFNKISLGIQGDVFVSQGPATKLTVEADEEILGLIETVVKNEELKIRFSQNRVRTKTPIRIRITTPEIEGLYLSGSGNIITDTPVKTEEIEIKVSGSGNIDIKDLTCDEVDAAISGSGNIDMGGVADELEIAISGSGDCNADQLQTKETVVKISGSGDCRVQVTKDLEVAISGSGSVYYAGNPKIEASISGSGKIREL